MTGRQTAAPRRRADWRRRPANGHSAASSGYCRPCVPDRGKGCRGGCPGFHLGIGHRLPSSPSCNAGQPMETAHGHDSRRHDPHLSRQQMRRILDRYRVTSGKGFRLKDHDPADTAGICCQSPQANAMLAHGVERLSELQEKLYAQKCVGDAVRASGDGCGRQGQHDQARDVRREPAGRAGDRLQGAGAGGTGARLPVARQPCAAATRPHRHLQPQPLRGGAGRAGASRSSLPASICRSS